MEKPLINTTDIEEIKKFLIDNKVSKKLIDNLTNEQLLDMSTINIVGLNLVKNLSKYEYPTDGKKKKKSKKRKSKEKKS